MPDPLNAATSPEIFVSYAREDRDAAQTLATALADAGHAVWWDRNLAGGEDFADVIAEHLEAARVVLVLWSRAAVNSNFVRDEASRARDAGKLLPLRIEEVQPPLGFGTIHTLDLIGWQGDRTDPAWQALLADLGRAPGPRPAPPIATRPGWRVARRPLLLAGGIGVLAGGGWFGRKAWREHQAQEQLQIGLQAHFAHDRNLQVARNAYLVALREDPQLGRAHYYLGHVYALLVLPRDARAQFALALRFASDLDDAQRDDARAQLAALSDVDAVAPVSRAAVESKPATVESTAGASAVGSAPGTAERAAEARAAAAPAARAAERVARAADEPPARSAAQPVPRPPPRPAPRSEPKVAPPPTIVLRGGTGGGLAPGSSASTSIGRAAGTAAGATAGITPGAATSATAGTTTRASGAAAAAEPPKPPAAPSAPPKPAPPPHLPRVPPSPERLRTIEARVDALFAPQAQTRLEAATALAVDPGMAADALPLAIDRSLAALRDSPTSDATAAGVANTLQLLLGASPATLRAHAEAAQRLAQAASALGDNQRAAAQRLGQLVEEAGRDRPPVAYLQIANEAQRPVARELAQRIRASGYAVPAIEVVGARAPSQTELRVQGGSAPGWGRWLAKVLTEVTGEPAKLSTLRGARPATDTFEIWLDKDLCTARRVPACGD